MVYLHDGPLETAKSKRPSSRAKMHLYTIPIGKKTYRLVTLRPSMDIFYSTNFFHNTWHIISDDIGSQWLARLLWGLAYQKQANTMVLIHGRHILPTPFEAERSAPILLIPLHLTSVCAKDLKMLRSLLPILRKPSCTVRWQTFGLENATWESVQDGDWDYRNCLSRSYYDGSKQYQQVQNASYQGGFVCFAGSPTALKTLALGVLHMHTKTPYRMDYYDYAFGKVKCRYSRIIAARLRWLRRHVSNWKDAKTRLNVMTN